ncbi:mucin-2-like [Oncorhynchus nerka]|uniref:mucin-2-like n=1 Tax=Oncorhynchus nerka TaxID=8023 RepID=UPI0031B8A71C
MVSPRPTPGTHEGDLEEVTSPHTTAAAKQEGDIFTTTSFPDYNVDDFEESPSHVESVPPSGDTFQAPPTTGSPHPSDSTFPAPPQATAVIQVEDATPEVSVDTAVDQPSSTVSGERLAEPTEEPENHYVIEVGTVQPDILLEASPSTEPMFAHGSVEETTLEGITAEITSDLIDAQSVSTTEPTEPISTEKTKDEPVSTEDTTYESSLRVTEQPSTLETTDDSTMVMASATPDASVSGTTSQPFDHREVEATAPPTTAEVLEGSPNAVITETTPSTISTVTPSMVVTLFTEDVEGSGMGPETIVDLGSTAAVTLSPTPRSSSTVAVNTEDRSTLSPHTDSSSPAGTTVYPEREPYSEGLHSTTPSPDYVDEIGTAGFVEGIAPVPPTQAVHDDPSTSTSSTTVMDEATMITTIVCDTEPNSGMETTTPTQSGGTRSAIPTKSSSKPSDGSATDAPTTPSSQYSIIQVVTHPAETEGASKAEPTQKPLPHDVETPAILYKEDASQTQDPPSDPTTTTSHATVTSKEPSSVNPTAAAILIDSETSAEDVSSGDQVIEESNTHFPESLSETLTEVQDTTTDIDTEYFSFAPLISTSAPATVGPDGLPIQVININADEQKQSESGLPVQPGDESQSCVQRSHTKDQGHTLLDMTLPILDTLSQFPVFPEVPDLGQFPVIPVVPDRATPSLVDGEPLPGRGEPDFFSSAAITMTPTLIFINGKHEVTLEQERRQVEEEAGRGRGDQFEENVTALGGSEEEVTPTVFDYSLIEIPDTIPDKPDHEESPLESTGDPFSRTPLPLSMSTLDQFFYDYGPEVVHVESTPTTTPEQVEETTQGRTMQTDVTATSAPVRTMVGTTPSKTEQRAEGLSSVSETTEGPSDVITTSTAAVSTVSISGTAVSKTSEQTQSQTAHAPKTPEGNQQISTSVYGKEVEGSGIQPPDDDRDAEVTQPEGEEPSVSPTKEMHGATDDNDTADVTKSTSALPDFDISIQTPLLSVSTRSSGDVEDASVPATINDIEGTTSGQEKGSAQATHTPEEPASITLPPSMTSGQTHLVETIKTEVMPSKEAGSTESPSMISTTAESLTSQQDGTTHRTDFVRIHKNITKNKFSRHYTTSNNGKREIAATTVSSLFSTEKPSQTVSTSSHESATAETSKTALTAASSLHSTEKPVTENNFVSHITDDTESSSVLISTDEESSDTATTTESSLFSTEKPVQLVTTAFHEIVTPETSKNTIITSSSLFSTEKPTTASQGRASAESEKTSATSAVFIIDETETIAILTSEEDISSSGATTEMFTKESVATTAFPSESVSAYTTSRTTVSSTEEDSSGDQTPDMFSKVQATIIEFVSSYTTPRSSTGQVTEQTGASTQVTHSTSTPIDMERSGISTTEDDQETTQPEGSGEEVPVETSTNPQDQFTVATDETEINETESTSDAPSVTSSTRSTQISQASMSSQYTVSTSTAETIQSATASLPEQGSGDFTEPSTSESEGKEDESSGDDTYAVTTAPLHTTSSSTDSMVTKSVSTEVTDGTKVVEQTEELTGTEGHSAGSDSHVAASVVTFTDEESSGYLTPDIFNKEFATATSLGSEAVMTKSSSPIISSDPFQSTTVGTVITPTEEIYETPLYTPAADIETLELSVDQTTGQASTSKPFVTSFTYVDMEVSEISPTDGVQEKIQAEESGEEAQVQTTTEPQDHFIVATNETEIRETESTSETPRVESSTEFTQSQKSTLIQSPSMSSTDNTTEASTASFTEQGSGDLTIDSTAEAEGTEDESSDISDVSTRQPASTTYPPLSSTARTKQDFNTFSFSTETIQETDVELDVTMSSGTTAKVTSSKAQALERDVTDKPSVASISLTDKASSDDQTPDMFTKESVTAKFYSVYSTDKTEHVTSMTRDSSLFSTEQPGKVLTIKSHKVAIYDTARTAPTSVSSLYSTDKPSIASISDLTSTDEERSGDQTPDMFTKYSGVTDQQVMIITSTSSQTKTNQTPTMVLHGTKPETSPVIIFTEEAIDEDELFSTVVDSMTTTPEIITKDDTIIDADTVTMVDPSSQFHPTIFAEEAGGVTALTMTPHSSIAMTEEPEGSGPDYYSSSTIDPPSLATTHIPSVTSVNISEEASAETTSSSTKVEDSETVITTTTSSVEYVEASSSEVMSTVAQTTQATTVFTESSSQTAFTTSYIFVNEFSRDGVTEEQSNTETTPSAPVSSHASTHPIDASTQTTVSSEDDESLTDEMELSTTPSPTTIESAGEGRSDEDSELENTTTLSSSKQATVVSFTATQQTSVSTEEDRETVKSTSPLPVDEFSGDDDSEGSGTSASVVETSQTTTPTPDTSSTATEKDDKSSGDQTSESFTTDGFAPEAPLLASTAPPIVSVQSTKVTTEANVMIQFVTTFSPKPDLTTPEASLQEGLSEIAFTHRSQPDIFSEETAMPTTRPMLPEEDSSQSVDTLTTPAQSSESNCVSTASPVKTDAVPSTSEEEEQVEASSQVPTTEDASPSAEGSSEQEAEVKETDISAIGSPLTEKVLETKVYRTPTTDVDEEVDYESITEPLQVESEPSLIETTTTPEVEATTLSSVPTEAQKIERASSSSESSSSSSSEEVSNPSVNQSALTSSSSESSSGSGLEKKVTVVSPVKPESDTAEETTPSLSVTQAELATAITDSPSLTHPRAEIESAGSESSPEGKTASEVVTPATKMPMWEMPEYTTVSPAETQSQTESVSMIQSTPSSEEEESVDYDNVSGPTLVEGEPPIKVVETITSAETGMDLGQMTVVEIAECDIN